MAASAPAAPPLFKAVASSTRPIYQLLKCINFTSKVHIQLREEGIRFTADNSRVMQGTAFLDEKLFTSFRLNRPSSQGENAQGDDDGEDEPPTFQIALSTLLEALQIFGSGEAASRTQRGDNDQYRSNIRNYRPDAFTNQALGIAGTCSLVYESEGAPFSVIIEEAGVTTMAKLNTYLPDIPDEIPFDREDIAFKIIMPARHLLDAMAELAVANPEKLTIVTSRSAPYLRFSGQGDVSACSFDLGRARELLETFTMAEGQRWRQTYKFDLIKGSTEAMRIASKVSFRGDGQGVLSWQFMVDVDGGGKSFLTFTFVPYSSEHDEEDETEEDEDEE